jgi:hypothetical protein
MSSHHISQHSKASERAARLRDNKRRHRQRQKAYISELEGKLREFQLKGVEITQEVQASARKVVEDNKRLRALLQQVGIPDHVIETWTPNVTGSSHSPMRMERDVRVRPYSIVFSQANKCSFEKAILILLLLDHLLPLLFKCLRRQIIYLHRS